VSCLTLSLNMHFSDVRTPTLLDPNPPSLPPSIPKAPPAHSTPSHTYLVVVACVEVVCLPLSHLSPRLSFLLGQSPHSQCRPFPFRRGAAASAAAADCVAATASSREGHRTETLVPREGGEREGGRVESQKEVKRGNQRADRGFRASGSWQKREVRGTTKRETRADTCTRAIHISRPLDVNEEGCVGGQAETSNALLLHLSHRRRQRSE